MATPQPIVSDLVAKFNAHQDVNVLPRGRATRARSAGDNANPTSPIRAAATKRGKVRRLITRFQRRSNLHVSGAGASGTAASNHSHKRSRSTDEQQRKRSRLEERNVSEEAVIMAPIAKQPSVETPRLSTSSSSGTLSRRVTRAQQQTAQAATANLFRPISPMRSRSPPPADENEPSGGTLRRLTRMMSTRSMSSASVANGKRTSKKNGGVASLSSGSAQTSKASRKSTNNRNSRSGSQTPRTPRGGLLGFVVEQVDAGSMSDKDAAALVQEGCGDRQMTAGQEVENLVHLHAQAAAKSWPLLSFACASALQPVVDAEAISARVVLLSIFARVDSNDLTSRRAALALLAALARGSQYAQSSSSNNNNVGFLPLLFTERGGELEFLSGDQDSLVRAAAAEALEHAKRAVYSPA